MSHLSSQPPEITAENLSQSPRSAGSARAREKRFADVLGRRMAYWMAVPWLAIISNPQIFHRVSLNGLRRRERLLPGGKARRELRRPAMIRQPPEMHR